MYSILVWFGTNLLAPELSQSALSEFRKSDWRKRLTKQVTRESERPFNRRRLRRWLSLESTWHLLVSAPKVGTDAIVDSLASGLAKRGAATAEDRELAEYLLSVVVGSFLPMLDPSYGIAVSHHREMGLLGEINEKLDDRSAFSSNLSRLVPAVARILQSERANGPVACERLAAWMVEVAASVAPALRDLIDSPPSWLQNGPPRLWIALGEYAVGHRQFIAAATCFSRAANDGVPEKWRLQVLAALNLAHEGDTTRALELLDVAAGATSQPEHVLAAREAVQENLPQVVDAVPADSEDVFFLLMSARACSSLLRFDEAIVRGERALELDDESADARLILAEALQFRAVNRGTNSQRADLVRSVDLSIEARNLRRTWMVPSGDAAAVACQGCSMLNDSAKVLQLGRKEPDGEATEEESTNARTLVQVASAALQQAKIGVAQEALAELPDGFERMLLSGQILRATDNTEAALTALNNAYGIADDAPSKRQAQFQLALMGANPLPDQEDLEAVDTAETALLLATAEAARGESASAIARLRAWRSKSLECAIVLASVLASKGNHADAAEILSDVARRFNEPGSLVEAAKLLLAANDQEGAKARAEEALISLIENSVARRTALLILLKIAEAQQDWTRVERHARSLILDDPSSNEAHWSLVAALFNANLYDQAWAALVSADLKPENESEARAWMALATRNSNDPKLVDEILDLADVYESEEFGAAAIGAILQVPVDEDWPEARVTRFQNLTSEYVDRFPNGRYLQQLTFESPEDLVGILRDRLEPGAQEHLKLRRDVAQFRMPYVLLASSAGRPYAEAFLQRAAGCLTVSIGDAATLTKEIEDATAALDGTVVIDAASLVVLSYIPGTWSPIRGAFHSIRILEPSRADILQSRDQIVAMGVDSMGWNPVADAPVLHTVAPEVLAELRERATWVADRAIELDPITFSALNDESRSTDQRVLAAFGPLDYAQSHGIPLFSDDAFLRAHAWQSGVPTFGTAALLYALAGREAIATEEVNPLLQDLRRGYCVDLPPDSQQIIALAEEDHWRAGPGLFVFTRASLWRDTVSTMALFRACATRAFSEDKDLLAVWLAAGIQGLGSLTPPEHLPVAVAQLLLTVLTIPGSDPEQFAKLAQVARDMTKAFGAADPTEGMLRSFLDAAITSLGAEMGTRTFLALTDRFAGDDRDIVRRLAFGV